jgi:hypothetical protein
MEPEQRYKGMEYLHLHTSNQSPETFQFGKLVLVDNRKRKNSWSIFKIIMVLKWNILSTVPFSENILL